jgi:hypothetical protein
MAKQNNPPKAVDLFDRTSAPTPAWELHPERVSADGDRFLYVVMDHQCHSRIRWWTFDEYEKKETPVSIQLLRDSKKWDGAAS